MERNQAEACGGKVRSREAGPGAQLTLFDSPFDCRARPGLRLHTKARPACPRQHPRTELPPRIPLTSTGKLFERLYNSFRMKMFDAMGPRYGRILREAEREVRFLTPEFDTDALTDVTAPAVLELVEAAIRRAPFFQRAQLRKAACLLVSDLYEKNYELLESAGVLARLEDIYYRLKR